MHVRDPAYARYHNACQRTTITRLRISFDGGAQCVRAVWRRMHALNPVGDAHHKFSTHWKPLECPTYDYTFPLMYFDALFVQPRTVPEPVKISNLITLWFHLEARSALWPVALRRIQRETSARIPSSSIGTECLVPLNAVYIGAQHTVMCCHVEGHPTPWPVALRGIQWEPSAQISPSSIAPSSRHRMVSYIDTQHTVRSRIARSSGKALLEYRPRVSNSVLEYRHRMPRAIECLLH